MLNLKQRNTTPIDHRRKKRVKTFFMPKVSEGVSKWWWYSYCYRNSDGGLTFDNDVCARMHPIFEIEKDKWKTLISWEEISMALYYQYKKIDG